MALCASLPSAKARGAICVSVLESELSDTPSLDYQGVSASHQEGVGIYVPPTRISRFYCYMSRIFGAKIYATLNKEKCDSPFGVPHSTLFAFDFTSRQVVADTKKPGDCIIVTL